MKLLSTFTLIVNATRSINDDEYQIPSRRALQPAPIHSLDGYRFETGAGDYEVFLPIDDDTWGEFNIRQEGYIQKVNLIEQNKTFASVDDLLVVQSWSSVSAMTKPDFKIPSGECNAKYPKADPWAFVRHYETDESFQYNHADECDVNGCFLNVMEVETTNCVDFYSQVSVFHASDCYMKTTSV